MSSKFKKLPHCGPQLVNGNYRDKLLRLDVPGCRSTTRYLPFSPAVAKWVSTAWVALAVLLIPFQSVVCRLERIDFYINARKRGELHPSHPATKKRSWTFSFDLKCSDRKETVRFLVYRFVHVFFRSAASNASQRLLIFARVAGGDGRLTNSLP